MLRAEGYNLDDPTTPTTTATLQKTKADDVEVEMDNKGKIVAINEMELEEAAEKNTRTKYNFIYDK
nr:9024_t:CDS:2 [Entrophospora candida]